jgi:Domain of unknown function (DUF4190)
VAIDQTPSTSPPDSTSVPAIDNEFPAYRAISSTAVLSLVFGLASVFCFADLWFLLLSAGAVILGWVSIRKIRQLPEVLTGAGLARVGIGVGLLFGLTSLTRTVTEEVTITFEAGKFARMYVGLIRDEPVSMSLWYQQSLAYRNEKSPDAMVEEMKKQRSQMGGDAYQTAAKPILGIKERLDGGNGGDIAYDGIESKAIDGLTIYANALVKLDLKKKTGDDPDLVKYALLQMVKTVDEWKVREVLYPYTPRSAIAAAKHKDDDGHGH